MYSKVSFAHCVLYKVNGQGQHNVTALKLKLNKDTFDKLVSAIFFSIFSLIESIKWTYSYRHRPTLSLSFLKNAIICIEPPLFANNIVFLNRNAKQTRLKEMLKVFALKLKKPQNFPTF